MAKKILVVDDERDLVTTWEILLKSQGFDVITAFNGTEAVTKTLQGKPDLILLDVMMPGLLTGYQVYGKLQMDPHAKNIPIIVISARKNMEDLFPQSGLISFLSKPIDQDVLLAKIGQVLTIQNLGENKHVLIFGFQEFVTHKIKVWFEKKGYKVELPSNENDAIQKCEKLEPKFFFCQFCEDSTVLDAATVYTKARFGSGADQVNFYIYCTRETLAQAQKLFPSEVILPYNDTTDLLEKIEQNIAR